MTAANLRLIAIALVAGIVLGLVAWAAATCGSAKAPTQEGGFGPGFTPAHQLTLQRPAGAPVSDLARVTFVTG